MSKLTGNRRIADRVRTTIVGTALMFSVTATATAQTGALLRAPRVESRVRLQWDANLRRIVYAVDDETQFHALGQAPPFLTDGALVLTYPRLNPLRVSVTVAPKDGRVPADSVLASLRGLLSVSSVSIPPQNVTAPFTAMTAECPLVSTARLDTAALLSRLFADTGATTVARVIDSWRRSIDEAFMSGRTGPEAIATVIGDIDRLDTRLGEQLADADRIASRVESGARIPSADACAAAARTIYENVALANPRGRITQLTAVRFAMAKLLDSLSREYGAPVAMKWQGQEFRVQTDVRPTKQSPANLVVRATRIDFDLDQSFAALYTLDEHSGTEAIEVQRFSRFATDFAVASVVTTVTVPGYGTTANAAGATVVSRLPRSRASVTPGFLASFVCRCRTGPLVAPMLQVGITTSADTPGVLAGGGMRLFGLPKGEAALGAGAMFAWVKDLRHLRVGDPVGGTSDIQADLGYRNKNGYYVALQYKF